MATSNLGINIRAMDQFSGTFSKLKTELTGVKAAAGGLSSAFGTLASAGAMLGVGIGTAALVQFGREVAALGINMQEARGSFEALSRSANINSSGMLDDLRKASRGMTSDLDLIQSANRALMADNQVVLSNLTTIYQAAAIGADALGISVSDAFDRMTKSISAMQVRGLKEFGINVDASAANDAYAASLGRVASSLTQTEIEAAFATAAVAEMNDLITRAGPQVDSAGDNIDQFTSSIQNLKTALGELAVSTFATYLAPLLSVNSNWSLPVKLPDAICLAWAIS